MRLSLRTPIILSVCLNIWLTSAWIEDQPSQQFYCHGLTCLKNYRSMCSSWQLSPCRQSGISRMCGMACWGELPNITFGTESKTSFQKVYIWGLFQDHLSTSGFSLHTFLSDPFENKHYGHMLEINAVPKNANETEMVNYSRMSCL